jgi:hypothetical protein
VGITLQGGLYSREDIRGLIDSINEELEDGVELNTVAA